MWIPQLRFIIIYLLLLYYYFIILLYYITLYYYIIYYCKITKQQGPAVCGFPTCEPARSILLQLSALQAGKIILKYFQNLVRDNFLMIFNYF